jgi:hypothetical protein
MWKKCGYGNFNHRNNVSAFHFTHFWVREFYESGQRVRPTPVKWSATAKILRNTALSYVKLEKSQQFESRNMYLLSWLTRFLKINMKLIWMKTLIILALVHKDVCVTLRWTVFAQYVNLNIETFFSMIFIDQSHWYLQMLNYEVCHIGCTLWSRQIAFLTALLSAGHSWCAFFPKITFPLNSLLPLDPETYAILFLH